MMSGSTCPCPAYIDLAEWRQALLAERFARETFGGVAGVASIRVVPAEDVGFVVEIMLARGDPMLRRCMPSEVNEIPVRVRGP